MASGFGKAYRKSLMATVANMGAAYGYTITVWTSGAIAGIVYKQHTIGHMLIHAGGFVLAYALLIVLLFKPKQTAKHLSETEFPSYGFTHLLAVPCAVGAAYLSYFIPWPLFGYGLAGFTAGLTYNLVFALQLVFFMPKDVVKTPPTFVDELGWDDS